MIPNSLVLATFMTLALSVSVQAAEPEYKTIYNKITNIYREVRPKAPSKKQLLNWKKLFGKTLRASPEQFSSMKTAWERVGIKMTLLKTGPKKWWMLEDKKRRGFGLHIFAKSGQRSNIAIQVPHGRFDIYTDQIGIHLCLEVALDICSWNTGHRSQFDFAHTVANSFNSLTSAVVSENPLLTFVQIHGFSEENRESLPGRVAGMILSGTTDKAAPCIKRGADFLNNKRPHLAVRIFGHDVFELGGTKNIQGAIVRDLGSGHFLHSEISRPSRQQMLTDRRLRAIFYEALTEVAGDFVRNSASPKILSHVTSANQNCVK